MSPFIPTEFDQNVNVSKANPAIEAVRLVAGLAAIMVVLYVAVAAVLLLALPHMPVAWEYALWQKIMPSDEAVAKEEIQTVRGRQQAYLQELLDKMPANAKAAGYQFKVHVEEDDLINAFALPAGHIVVTTALLENTASENTLVFILGHELGHYQNRDHLRGMGLGITGIFLSLLVTGDHNAARTILSGVGELTGAFFSQKQESRADSWGLKAVQHHYGHVGGSVDFLEYVSESEGRFHIQWLSTHPLNKKRIAALRSEIKKNGWLEKSLRASPWHKQVEEPKTETGQTLQSHP